MSKKKTSPRDERTAEDAYYAIKADDGDETIAATVADWLTTSYCQPPFYLSITHDVRPSAERRIARTRKFWPDYEPIKRHGPCPLAFDWQRKDIVGIRTEDRDRARRWAIDAMLLGYSVFYSRTSSSPSSGCGTISEVRERRRKGR